MDGVSDEFLDDLLRVQAEAIAELRKQVVLFTAQRDTYISEAVRRGYSARKVAQLAMVAKSSVKTMAERGETLRARVLREGTE